MKQTFAMVSFTETEENNVRCTLMDTKVAVDLFTNEKIAAAAAGIMSNWVGACGRST
jgi:hypothetical protein